MFISPSRGKLNMGQVVAEIIAYVKMSPHNEYRLVIGSDSQTADTTVFVTAIIVHRVGKGARYFYRRLDGGRSFGLREKIYYEAILSLEYAEQISMQLAAAELADQFHIEIHLDIGVKGATNSLVKEIVGMVVSNGYEACIKPEAYGATKVADKHTKRR